jgi:hypothetical protein
LKAGGGQGVKMSSADYKIKATKALEEAENPKAIDRDFLYFKAIAYALLAILEKMK